MREGNAFLREMKVAGGDKNQTPLRATREERSKSSHEEQTGKTRNREQNEIYTERQGEKRKELVKNEGHKV